MRVLSLVALSLTLLIPLIAAPVSACSGVIPDAGYKVEACYLEGSDGAVSRSITLVGAGVTSDNWPHGDGAFRSWSEVSQTYTTPSARTSSENDTHISTATAWGAAGTRGDTVIVSVDQSGKSTPDLASGDLSSNNGESSQIGAFVFVDLSQGGITAEGSDSRRSQGSMGGSCVEETGVAAFTGFTGWQSEGARQSCKELPVAPTWFYVQELPSKATQRANQAVIPYLWCYYRAGDAINEESVVCYATWGVNVAEAVAHAAIELVGGRL